MEGQNLAVEWPAYRQLIKDHAAALHLPAIFPFPEEAEEDAFAACGPSLNTLFAEIMPQQIITLFRGAKVAGIPIEQSTRFKLIINLKTANATGVTVPSALLLRADKLIEWRASFPHLARLRHSRLGCPLVGEDRK